MKDSIPRRHFLKQTAVLGAAAAASPTPSTATKGTPSASSTTNDAASKTASTAPPSATGTATSPPPKQTIDLLALIDLAKDRVAAPPLTGSNNWSRSSSGSLIYHDDGKPGKIVPPAAINARTYEFEITFQRGDATNQFNIDLPIDATPTTVPTFLGVPGTRFLSGKAGEAWPTGLLASGRVILRCEATTGGQSRVTVNFDGKPVGDWTGDLRQHRFKVQPHPDFPGQIMTSIFCRGGIEIKALVLRVFDGTATVLRPSTQSGTAMWPQTESIDVGGGVKMELVLIPAGSFIMGSDTASTNEMPVHKVTFTKPFYLGKFEVTQEQWQMVMGSNPSRFKGSKLPVERVGWDDCQIFLAKLQEKTGRKFALPTEAQWEYACRAGTTNRYSFGDNATSLAMHAWFGSNSGSTTHPVGAKKPNPWGLYDMHGNVWEWCAEWYGSYPSEGATDPQGASSGSTRLLRGGAWDYDAAFLRSTYRLNRAPEVAAHNFGLRCVLVMGEAAP